MRSQRPLSGTAARIVWIRTPAQAGVQGREHRRQLPWIPACAGMRESDVTARYSPDAKLSSSSLALAGTSSAALLKLRLPLGPITRVCGLIVQL